MFLESAASTVANSSSSKKPRLDQITSGNLDADDPLDDDDVSCIFYRQYLSNVNSSLMTTIAKTKMIPLN